MKKILLIEDDADLFGLVKYNLDLGGYATAGSRTGKDAIELCRRERPDLVLLDINLPECDGLEICRCLRAEPDLSHIPVIFITARASETDRIVGLEVGANDYVVKPFFVRELIARVKVQLREVRKRAEVLRSGPLSLDRTRYEVRLGNRTLPMTATEFKLLEYLMSGAGAVFGRDQILDAVWGQDRDVTARTVDVYVMRLRQKLQTDPLASALIRSVRGFGYSFSMPSSDGS
jgi:DNA-binding response OmpR family regulator